MMPKGWFWRQTRVRIPTVFPTCMTPENLINLAQSYLLIYKRKARIMYMLQDCGN